MEYTPQALRPEVYINWSRTYVLDQYALQALRPEVQKEKLNSTTRGPGRSPGLTSWTSMHFRPYGLKCKKKTTTRGPGRSPGPLIASQAVGLRCSILYTLFLLEKEKVWQKEKARGIWAVRPRFHFCPSGKTIERCFFVESNFQFTSWWYTMKYAAKIILACFLRLSIGKLRLGPSSWTPHQCTRS